MAKGLVRPNPHDPCPGASSKARSAFARTVSALLPLALVAAIGCALPRSSFVITDFRETNDTRRYRELFDEAYYDQDAHGNVDVVLRREVLSLTEPTHTITQLIHINSVWRSIPGDTVAHSTQINGTVRYCIMAGSAGASFEGAGSVFFTQNKSLDELHGTLEVASLKPRYQRGGGYDLFRRAEIEGEFHARRDRRRVVRLIQEMSRTFSADHPVP